MRKLQIRTSERASWKRCPRQWAWAYVDRITTKRPSNPLWFGTIVHQALADWYGPGGNRRGPNPVETALELLDENRPMIVRDEDDEADYVSAEALLEAMLSGYLEKYGTDPQWDVIGAEMPFEIRLRSREPEKYWIEYCGTFDLVVRDVDTGFLWIVETKTAQSIRTDHLPIDEQNGTYFAMAKRVLLKKGLVEKSDKFAGVRYNFLRKGLPDGRPRDDEGYATNKPKKADYLHNEEFMAKYPLANATWTMFRFAEEADKAGLTVLGERSKTQSSPLFLRHDNFRSPAQNAKLLDRVRDEARYMERMKAGDPTYPIWKTPTRDCARFCEFYELCHLDEQGDTYEVENMKKVLYKPRDPYEAHNHNPVKEG